MIVSKKQIQEFLIDTGLITEGDYENAEAEASKSKGKLTSAQILIHKGKITEDDFRRAEAFASGISFVSLVGHKIDQNVLSLIPEPISRQNNIVAFKRSNDTLEVALLDINDLACIEFVKKKIGLRILPRLADTDSIKSALLQYQKNLRTEFGDIIQKDSIALSKILERQALDDQGVNLKKQTEYLPVVRILDTLLKHAILQSASDIHIETLKNELLIRYRINNTLYDAMVLPKNVAESIITRLKVLANLNLTDRNIFQDGRFDPDAYGYKISAHISILPTYFGEKVVIKLLQENSSGFTLESLGFHGEPLETLHRAISQTSGLVIATGHLGSGRTTTLYTLLDILNKPSLNISTIEDPVEYPMPRINQTQIKPEMGLTFVKGLRSILKQDPDIIMVGEIQDAETASLTINAATGGHLILSTLEADSAVNAASKLSDIGIDGLSLTSTINVIINQRLVRKLDENKEKYYLSKSKIASLSEIVDLDKVIYFLKKEKVIDEKATVGTIPFYKAKGSVKNKDGYSGQICLYEILRFSPAIKDLILNHKNENIITEQARKEGMMTLAEDGIFKAVQGITTIEEVCNTFML